ncbi:lipoyl(octanoyl) transferase [Cyphellophora europaea CBS 101466]|uniref:Lipoyl(Octanoyl) transferase n=1 Tax=Cyphellophora europaea (strain CBS 101466) TaxID=1220924 RepID=W2S9A9_CYPE1|nr:lipoyl(octanoyl) transferase [Cyphellophora europaea CBS 101466]ETN45311.1 lipoyl(octanoyl) transferase [Cyphellophora europaea CBS 101466]
MAPPSPATGAAHPLKLLHIRLPSRIQYTTALRLQDSLLNLHWRHRAALKAPTPTHKPPPPPPILLTFTTPPTYTVGRRHLQQHPLSPSQIAFLTRSATAATFHASSRGGLLTYHGPGQLTAFPLVDLRRFGLSARCYVSLLEGAVIRTCDAFLATGNQLTQRRRRATGRSAGDPGVWMLTDDGEGGASDRKICALGVQVSRGVGGYGLGLNVRDEGIEEAERGRFVFDDQLPVPLPAGASADTDANAEAVVGEDGGSSDAEEKGYLSWGFGRIVACGLEGKRTTWLTREGADPAQTHVGPVANRLAEELVLGLNEMSGSGKETVQGVRTLELELAEGDVRDLETGVLRIEEMVEEERGIKS